MGESGRVRRCRHGVRLQAVGERGEAGAGRWSGPCRQAGADTVTDAGMVERRELVEGLRALARFLEADPRLPVGQAARVELSYFPEGCDGRQEDEVLRLARRMGTPADWEGALFVTEKRFG
ncbi:hypothetical protein [Nocardiopsis sp. NPDC057823]|uniref:hypothetical protein n=1 Tax=Nocardiopsis sp. NPDC057823 TaxID=3346256 RepID=UPI00366E2C1D